MTPLPKAFGPLWRRASPLSSKSSSLRGKGHSTEKPEVTKIAVVCCFLSLPPSLSLSASLLFRGKGHSIQKPAVNRNSCQHPLPSLALALSLFLSLSLCFCFSLSLSFLGLRSAKCAVFEVNAVIWSFARRRVPSLQSSELALANEGKKCVCVYLRAPCLWQHEGEERIRRRRRRRRRWRKRLTRRRQTQKRGGGGGGGGPEHRGGVGGGGGGGRTRRRRRQFKVLFA
jgi:hypothetical protein